MATVAEIKAELDEAGVEYPHDARKAELEGLLADAAVDGTEAPLQAGRHPLPAEAQLPTPPSRAERRAAQPGLPPQLEARREARRRQYVLQDGVLTFMQPPSELTQVRVDDGV